MVGNESKTSPIEVKVKLLDCKHQSQRFFFQLSIVAFTGLEANAMGLSSPFGMMCDMTAPIPYAEASAANHSGRSGL